MGERILFHHLSSAAGTTVRRDDWAGPSSRKRSRVRCVVGHDAKYLEARPAPVRPFGLVRATTVAGDDHARRATAPLPH